MKREVFLTQFASTFGPIVGIPEEWEDPEETIVHEVGGHVNQFGWFGLFIPYVGPWIGILGMILFYGLLFPVGFNWFRYRLELHADKQRWKYMLQHGVSSDAILERAMSFAETISSWQYGKPIPKSWALWGFSRVARKVNK